MISLTKQVLLKGTVFSNPILFFINLFFYIIRLFYGKIRQRITSVEAFRSSVHEKEDLFSHLPVNVANDGIDIYDGLSGYFDDVVEFQGRKAKMEVTLVDLPPLLQIQLQVGNSILSFVLILRVRYCRECNLIVRLSSPTNHKLMSNLEKIFTWIVLWMTQTLTRRHSRRVSKLSLTLAEREYDYLWKAR